MSTEDKDDSWNFLTVKTCRRQERRTLRLFFKTIVEAKDFKSDVLSMRRGGEGREDDDS